MVRALYLSVEVVPPRGRALKNQTGMPSLNTRGVRVDFPFLLWI